MFDEGVIKFQCSWAKGNITDFEVCSELNKWRKYLYDLGLIGELPGGIGYGNISARVGRSEEFIISGTQTGVHEFTGNHHYTKIINYDVKKNSVSCLGPIKASSETMTHAVLYQYDKNINVIFHSHHDEMWEALKEKIPTTSSSVPYGTVEMAEETIRLFEDTDLKHSRLFAMGGHHGGLVAFGRNFQQAAAPFQEYML